MLQDASRENDLVESYTKRPSYANNFLTLLCSNDRNYKKVKEGDYPDHNKKGNVASTPWMWKVAILMLLSILVGAFAYHSESIKVRLMTPSVPVAEPKVSLFIMNNGKTPQIPIGTIVNKSLLHDYHQVLVNWGLSPKLGGFTWFNCGEHDFVPGPSTLTNRPYKSS
jgi:hypothetical protein